jgi:predicted nucleic acid-binding protein
MAVARFGAWDGPRLDAALALLDELLVVDVSHPEVARAYAHLGNVAPDAPHNVVWIAASARAADARLLTLDRRFERFSDELKVRFFAGS